MSDLRGVLPIALLQGGVKAPVEVVAGGRDPLNRTYVAPSRQGGPAVEGAGR
jgi:hypothetical protein